MIVHLVDGTYELFRSYYALPPLTAPDGRPVGAVRGLIQSILYLLRQSEVTHIGCAFDHVVESFRNDMFAGYKTGEGTPEDLRAQFDLAERAVASLGVVVWPMVEFEADDAIATATAKALLDPAVERVVVCSPDKDLAQLVEGDRVVCFDRRRGEILDVEGVWAKFGVAPESIPDLLALTGDSADGIPGVPKWGAKTSAQVLGRYDHIERIPADHGEWEVQVRGAKGAAESLASHQAEVRLYKELTILRTDVPLNVDDGPEGSPQAWSVDQLEWHGVKREDYLALCEDLGFGRLAELPHKWAG